MSGAPAIVIYLPLEGRPVVAADYVSEADQLRMADWLNHHPELFDLLERALQLAHDLDDLQNAA